MKIAVFGKKTGGTENDFIHSIIRHLFEQGVELIVYETIIKEIPFHEIGAEIASFSTREDLVKNQKIDYLFSLGGDGTFLYAANIVGDLGIPIVGINTGRIGFLTGINRNNFKESFDLLVKGAYTIEERALLHLECDHKIAENKMFALNDITIRPSDDDSMNSIKVWINNEYVNTYWADGLIIATPTGSTAYSLSCGGPILSPSLDGTIITPIASHTLAVRPIVVSADAEIKISVESRSEKYSLSCDSQKFMVNNPAILTISKEKFSIKTVRFISADFYSVIREKLMWGIDKRTMSHE